jgi:hypothetical protein
VPSARAILRGKGPPKKVMLAGRRKICSSSSIIALVRDRFEMYSDKKKVDFVGPRILRSISASISRISDRDPVRPRLDLDRRSHPDNEPDIRRDRSIRTREACRSLPHGGDHEFRREIAQKLLNCAVQGNKTLSGLTKLARAALAEAIRNSA